MNGFVAEEPGKPSEIDSSFARGATPIIPVPSAFPGAAARLDDCAGDFDAVRYLGRSGAPEQWDRIVALEAELRDARPVRAESLEELLEAPR